MNRGIECGIYTMKYDSAIKESEIMSFSGKWMELEITMSSRISQTGKDKHHVSSMICGL
jgi:hypothetical protein